MTGTEPGEHEVDPQPATILDRLRAAGIAEDRARSWITQGSVHVEGETVGDVEAPAPWPARWTLVPA